MAEQFTQEGLDLILDIFPRGGATLATTYLALFTSFSASTVSAGASPPVETADSYTEPDFGSYARQSIAAASWAAITAGTGGRKTSAAQVTFPTATGNASTTVKGFWLANQLSATGDKSIFAANFDDVTAVQINTNDIIKVTPTIQYNF